MFISRLSKIFLFVVLVCVIGTACLFFALKSGISIDEYRLGDISVSHFHLRLQKKLYMTVGNIHVVPEQKGQEKPHDFSGIQRAMTYIDLALKCFDSITIKEITLGETIAGFVYKSDGTGVLTVKNPAFSLETKIAVSGSHLTFVVDQFQTFSYRSQGSGRIMVDVSRTKVTGDLKVKLANTLPLQLHLQGDRYKLTFDGKSTEAIRDIRPVVELFALGPDIQPWITDSLKGDSFTLDTIKGTIPFAAPEKVLDSLYGRATVQNCEYSFEPKLPPIKAHSVNVIFENGVLKIFPHQTTYAGLNAGRSWLDIDFNTDDPILTAFIRTNAALGDEILDLLDFYKIHLPFKQTEGLIDADLTLSINLVNLKVGADGNFKVMSGSFSYDKKVYTITDSTVLLNDDDVTIKELNIEYQDIARLKVNGKIDVLSDKADLKIAVDKFDVPFQNEKLSLDVSKKKVFLQYRRAGENEAFTVSKSDWKIGTLPIEMEGFTTSVKTPDLSGTLHEIPINFIPYSRILLSGDFNLKKPSFHFVADIQKLDSGDIKLDQPRLLLKLDNVSGLEISSDKQSNWQIKGKKILIDPIKLNYADQKIKFSRIGLHLENFLTASLHGTFDIAAEKGTFLFDQMEIDNLGKNAPDFSGKNFTAVLAIKDGTISATIQDLGLSYQRKPDSGWAVHVEALGELYDRSDFLQRFNLNQGSADFWQSDAGPLMFSGTITYPYDFLVKNNIPVNVYDIKGQYDAGVLDATINDELHLHYADRMQVSSSGVGYNFSALRSYLEDHLGKDNGNSDDDIPDFDLLADKTALYLNHDQSAPADRIQIHSEGGKLSGQLQYGKGKAELEMNNVNFTLLGQDFGEKFLDGILKDSQFIGGKLSFYVSGLLTKFKGVMKIENSVVKNGAILNNIMAFISTVPDLITFSLPGYSLQGMPFSRLYAGFSYDNHAIDVTAFALESNALDMTGTGQINLVKNSIKMNIDLISKTKKYISKIPLLGYLLVGDTKQPTITLNVMGKLDDPDVSTSVYKEIVKTPFDILLRTISLPGHLLKQLEQPEKEPSYSGKSSPEGKKP